MIVDKNSKSYMKEAASKAFTIATSIVPHVCFTQTPAGAIAAQCCLLYSGQKNPRSVIQIFTICFYFWINNNNK